MGAQKHDLGYRKRRLAETRDQPTEDPDNTEELARRLVERGLCSPRILDGGRR